MILICYSKINNVIYNPRHQEKKRRKNKTNFKNNRKKKRNKNKIKNNQVIWMEMRISSNDQGWMRILSWENHFDIFENHSSDVENEYLFELRRYHFSLSFNHQLQPKSPYGRMMIWSMDDWWWMKLNGDGIVWMIKKIEKL